MDSTRTKQGIERKDDPVWEEKTPSGAVKRKGGSYAWDDDDQPKLVRTNANVPLGDSFGMSAGGMSGMSGMSGTTSSATMGATTSVNMSVNSTKTNTNVTTAGTMAATAGVAVGESAKETPQARPAKEKVTGKSAKFTSIRTTITEEEMTANGVPRENPFLVDAPKNKVVKVRKKE